MRSWMTFSGCVGFLLLAACGGTAAPVRPATAAPATVPALELPRVQPSGPPPPGAEAVSLFGEALASPPLSPEVQAEREASLAAAQAEVDAHPDDAGALIWLGRRTAYLGRYREAIEIYTRALAKHPDDPRLLRHRGHRYLTQRRFDLAAADLERAAGLVTGLPDEAEPDGLPNERNTPVSSLHTNIWYHLGLAHYLTGDLASAERAFRECLKVSQNPDMQVSTLHWLYMTLRRQGRVGEADEILAPVRTDMDIVESRAYHLLTLMYKGEIPPDSVRTLSGQDHDPALAYGLADWHLYNGRQDEAVQGFREILAGGEWASFGYIAAEADLKRLDIAP